jgi:hypothetical protein
LVDGRHKADGREQDALPDFGDQLLEGVGFAVAELLDAVEPPVPAGPVAIMPTSA